MSSSSQSSQGGISPQMLEQLKQHGPPYPPTGAGLGGRPTVAVDVPISAVFIFLFILSAVLNMTILQRNQRRGHKFVLSGLLFGFSMARITANVMRIVWATRPANASIAIAASVLTNAGVVLLFVVNLLLVQRLLRAYHPHFGWSRPVSLAFRFLYFSIAAAIIMVIIAVVYSFYTLDVKARMRIREVQLTGVVFLAVLAFLPIPIGLAAGLVPGRYPRDPFGQSHPQGRARSLRFKLILVLTTSALLSLGASFRAGTAFFQRPASNPAWFHSKTCYYCFNYTIEIVCVFTYALLRFDRLFHIPDGSSGPGHYAGRGVADQPEKSGRFEEPLDSERPPTASEQQEQETRWDAQLRSELQHQAV
ncbi:hypothetical protein CCM_04273 [Cordyceps militaris CM01]|uniref:Family c-likeg-protein-coupled receptor protein n=2 Tax=Cordyceps militaris TaxID=73501 RepID=G3JE76_CORMM|nr:uncharacterized protein CCM_04273 [Cordyceps militaris CM01]ATY64206.1 hypothetical protein A9K55_004381 [Cordyceps militaris]EGX92901.1 hypothetical protein CCM_04273 [Cordyceps militaris CM01]